MIYQLLNSPPFCFHRDERRPPYHEFSAERAYYENVRTPGLYTDDPRREYPGRSRDRYSELDHYQSEHYDPRYHEDPREYRDYRDPFEQDMRKYTYIQRERERERERFEADRGRWSPSHQRRPVTPSASPSPSDRVPRESERRVYRHSSERSGSCSSLSPPPPAPFEKPEKSPVEYKNEGLEREMESVEMERVGGTERSRRGRRKDKGDKEKGERGKSRRGKMPSPVASHSETDKEASLDANLNKGKASDTDGPEKSRYKGDNEPSPSEQMSRLESLKVERLDAGKGDASDRDGKGRLKKHLKSDLGSEGKDLVLESDRLAARKRRFADPSGKTIRQKRGRLDDEGIQSPEFGANSAIAKETEDAKALDKETQKREHLKPKVERGSSHYSLKDDQESSSLSGLRGQGLSSTVRQGEPSDIDDHDSGKNLSAPSVSRSFSHEENLDQENKGREEYLSLDIDLSQSYRKQMEQNRRLRQQLQEPDKLGKPGSPQSVDTEDLEHRSLVHEVGKPPQDVTDNSPSSRNKKQDTFELDLSSKRERVYRSFRPKSEDSEWNSTNSPKPQQSSQNTEEEMMDMPHLMTVKDVKDLPKSEETVHPDLELAVKRVHTTQMTKLSTHLHGGVDDAHKRWESRLKQDLLPDFSGRKRLGRKHLEYGLWPDLEPGEVRSDSEEDREHKANSPMPSTSLSLPERHRGERLSESKLSTSLERNKFYSFALDQTITPDTKALLERAKSLSSSREDNWSFLDYDSHFASFRSRKDTEKVEATPRPTPSWYMKKKKIRSESEDKLDDRKEDPKPEEHERRELFASRFLHSSIFEQDSRRLQHLERKHEDSEQNLGNQATQQGAGEGQADSEPVVLFHSRFLELTRLQHKGKDVKEPQLETKRGEAVDDGRIDTPQEQSGESQEQPQPVSQPASESAVEPEMKPVSPIQALPLPQIAQPSKEMSPPSERNIQSIPAESSESSVKEEENECEKSPVPPLQQMQEEQPPAISPVLPELPLTELKEPMTVEAEMSIKSEKAMSEEQLSSIESKPSKVAETNVEIEREPEPEVSNLISSASPTPNEEAETLKTLSGPIGDESQVKQEVDSSSVDTLSVEEPVSPPQKSKNKKTRASPPTPVAPLASPSSADKQATRKSERMKRASSPRGEMSKTATEPKTTNKSPVQGSETEQVTEQRRRRRNVRSVYATPVEDESTTQPSREVEPSRSARKRGGDKEVAHSLHSEQDILTTPTTRRGRPPKNRPKVDDTSTLKAKTAEPKELENMELGSSENVLKTKSKHSPQPQKQTSQTPASSTSTKKGEKLPDTNQQADLCEDINPPDSAPQSDFISLGERVKATETVKPSVEEEQQKDGITDRAAGDKADTTNEPPIIEELPQAEKSGRSKGSRLIRNTKLPSEDKSLGLKNLRIRLDVTEVMRSSAMLQSGEEDVEMEELNKKTELLPKDQLMECPQEKEMTNSDKDETSPDSKITDPVEVVSSREIEQAVEHISKFTEGPSPQPSRTEVQSPVVPLPVEPEPPVEVEKPALPANETELAAAIDSITSEDSSCALPQEPAISTVMDSEPAVQSFDSKNTEPSSGSAPIQEETGPTGTPRKGAKGRAKTTKRPKNQKPAAGKKDSIKDIADPDTPQINAPDTVSDTQAVAENPPPTSIVITSPSKLNVPHPAENISEEPVDEPIHGRSAGLVNKSPNILKPPQPYECTPLSPTSVCLKTSHSSRLPLSPTDRYNQSRDTPMAPVAQGENHTVSPGSETHDPDSSNSDLRKILMKPKNIPLSGSNTAPGSLPTHPPRESESPSEIVVSKAPLAESRHLSLPAQQVVRSPGSLPSTETKQLFEKTVISVIASTATSVISRICNTSESEEKANIPRNNPYGEKHLAKQMIQTSIEASSTYHGAAGGGEEGGNAGRFVLDSATHSTGPSPGLRVNTSEGVVVLSHSGQKMEGPQRISAKISQIPPASPADMESQQLVSMPQMKPDHYAQTPSAKCPLVPSDHGHPHKTQSSVSTKQENSLDKMEYQAGGQSGVVKRLQQSGGNPQVMSYHHSEFPMLMKHPKKAEGAEPLSDGAKPSWASAISPAISPHLPSSAGNPVGFLPNTPTDRAPTHLSGIKEPRSPRKPGHPHSPFTKVSPIGSSSPKSMPVVLPSGLPPMSQYVPNVHHSEQSVIMPPHSTHGSIGRMSPARVGQPIPIGHLSQGDVRVNTPPLAMMNYGMHSDPLSSPWSGPPQQCPTSPQAVGSRDMVLKVNPGNRVHEANEEETRRYQALGRPTAAALKPETLPPDYRGALHSGLPLDRYSLAQRDMRVLMHHQPVERPASELHHGPEPIPSSSSTTSITASLSPRGHLLAKNVAEKDALKQSEVNRPLSPVTKEGIIGIRGAMPAIASPQRIQLLTSGTSPAFSEYPAVYTNIRSVPSQFTENSPLSINQAPHIASSQVSKTFTLYLNKY